MFSPCLKLWWLQWFFYRLPESFPTSHPLRSRSLLCFNLKYRPPKEIKGGLSRRTKTTTPQLLHSSQLKHPYSYAQHQTCLTSTAPVSQLLFPSSVVSVPSLAPLNMSMRLSFVAMSELFSLFFYFLSSVLMCCSLAFAERSRRPTRQSAAVA